MKRLLIALGVLAVAGVLGYQQVRTNRLERELLSLRTVASMPAVPEGESRTVEITRPGDTVVQRVPMDPEVYNRLGELEDQMATMRSAAGYLMERGEVPLGGEKLGEMIAKLNDTSLSERERLGALRLLRRSDALDDTTLSVALGWLNTSTNSGVREDILGNLEGLTNPILKAPLMQLALNDADPEIREQAIDNLGRYISDPAVEQQLWSIMNSDAPRNVRDEAMNAMRRGELPQHRVTALQRTALSADAALEDRYRALRLLERNDDVRDPIITSLATQAYHSNDSQERAQIFGMLDNFPSESAKVPLVYGLEDADPTVRRRAADALSSYRDDPAVQEWLSYVAENDADPNVRREASRSLQEIRRRRR